MLSFGEYNSSQVFQSHASLSAHSNGTLDVLSTDLNMLPSQGTAAMGSGTHTCILFSSFCLPFYDPFYVPFLVPCSFPFLSFPSTCALISVILQGYSKHAYTIAGTNRGLYAALVMQQNHVCVLTVNFSISGLRHRPLECYCLLVLTSTHKQACNISFGTLHLQASSMACWAVLEARSM